MKSYKKSGLRERLETRIQSGSLLKHPFYQDWQAGRLTLEDLRLYAGQYYHFEASFPRFLSAIHSRCDQGDVRQVILDNLWDEDHGSKNHRALWLDFARGLGMDHGEVEQAPALPSTPALMETYNRRCFQGSYLEGLAAIYAYESQAPQVMEEKLRGLRERYGITQASALGFFEVHRGLDREHAHRELAAILAHTAPEDEAGVEEAAQEALDAWWGFLDGVHAAIKGSPACR